GGMEEFETLAEAVAAARAGDTIEVRGNGPFVVEPIGVDKALRIRAAQGCRPVVQMSPKTELGGAALVSAEAPLGLQGLQFQESAQEAPSSGQRPIIIWSERAPVHLPNCRFLVRDHAAIVYGGPLLEVRNCEIFTRTWYAVEWVFPGSGRLILDNNAII